MIAEQKPGNGDCLHEEDQQEHPISEYQTSDDSSDSDPDMVAPLEVNVDDKDLLLVRKIMNGTRKIVRDFKAFNHDHRFK